MKILARNLSRKITEQELRKTFEPFGKVESTTLVLDTVTGKSKGFGFVEMPKLAEANKAIKELNGLKLQGDKIRVKVADQKTNLDK